MKTSLNRIQTKDGIELVGLLYEPEIVTKKILVYIHGMAGNFYENKFLDFIARTLTDNGTAFFTFNNRGCEYIKDLAKIEEGKRNFVRIGDTYEKFEDCLLDIEAGIDFAEEKEFSEIHLAGHSLGGPKIAYYASQTKDARLKSLVFVSPADMVGLAEADKDFERDITTATKMIAEGRGEEIMPFLIWGENYLTANTFLSLSAEDSKVSVFSLYDPENKLSVLGQITIPTIIIMGKTDSATVVPVDELMTRVKSAMMFSSRIETVILGDAGHIYIGYEEQLAAAINTWLQKIT